MRSAGLALLLLALGACGPTAGRPIAKEDTVSAADSAPAPRAAFLGLRTAKYSATDLAAARDWYRRVLGIDPYFDEPFYVGFNVGGYELGIVPDSAAARERPESGVAYWGVTSADSAHARLVELGATPFEAVQDVGEGIRIGAVRDPFGNILGVIENPTFRLPGRE